MMLDNWFFDCRLRLWKHDNSGLSFNAEPDYYAANEASRQSEADY